MNGLNYHHLLYFWKVAKTGSIAKASAELKLTQPTISEQIRLLEASLDRKLFERAGRSLALTPTGEKVYGYAEKIFALGGELSDSLSDVAVPRPEVLRVGVHASIAASTVLHLLSPALRATQRPVFEVQRRSPEDLVSRLLAGKFDLVLTDMPPANHGAHAHLVLDCGTLFVEVKRQRPSTARFPRSLSSRPFLLPPQPLADKLRTWFRTQQITPAISATFDVYDDLLAFAREGVGAFAIPELKGVATPGLRVLGRTAAVRSRFSALTRERRPQNVAIAAILHTTPPKRR